MRIGTHPATAGWRQLLQFGNEAAVCVEKFFRLITPHPSFEQFEVLGIAARISDWHLMGAPETFDLQTIDFLRSAPALRAAQHNHRPRGSMKAGSFRAGALL